MIQIVNEKNQQVLLNIAREALERKIRLNEALKINADTLDDEIRQSGATFVTLHINRMLRGCIGTLLAHQPIFADVAEHAVAAGTQDYRFPSVRQEELSAIQVEISILSQPEPIQYQDADDLLAQLQPGVHGVVLVSGMRRATFLPQVWQSIPEKEQFLDQLCIKMGAAPASWRKNKYKVSLYEVQEFSE